MDCKADNEVSKLTSISVSGFKSIGNTQTISLDNINIFIGANGSGKTSFVSFFKMLNYIITGGLQTYIGVNGTAERLLHFGSRKTPIIKSSLQFDNSKNKDIYNFSLAKTNDNTLIFLQENLEWNGKQISIGNGGHRESGLSSGFIDSKPQRIAKNLLSKCRAFQFHDTSDSSHIRNACEINNNRCLFSDGGNIAAMLYLFKNSKQYYDYYKRIVDFIRFIFPEFNDFILELKALNPKFIELQWNLKGVVEYPLNSSQLSDGTIRFIALAVLFLQPPDLLPNVIVVDEPELGLHPQAIDVLANMIEIASKHSQVIVATQSPRLIDNFSADQIIVCDYDNIKKESIYKRLSSEELRDWIEKYSLSQLWEKNIIGGQP